MRLLMLSSWTAAVSDFRVANKAPQKIKKMETMTLELVKNPDILKGLGELKTQSIACWFCCRDGTCCRLWYG